MTSTESVTGQRGQRRSTLLFNFLVLNSLDLNSCAFNFLAHKSLAAKVGRPFPSSSQRFQHIFTIHVTWIFLNFEKGCVCVFVRACTCVCVCKCAYVCASVHACGSMMELDRSCSLASIVRVAWRRLPLLSLKYISQHSCIIHN